MAHKATWLAPLEGIEWKWGKGSRDHMILLNSCESSEPMVSRKSQNKLHVYRSLMKGQ